MILGQDYRINGIHLVAIDQTESSYLIMIKSLGSKLRKVIDLKDEPIENNTIHIIEEKDLNLDIPKEKFLKIKIRLI